LQEYQRELTEEVNKNNLAVLLIMIKYLERTTE
jgi:hypothetical protein